MDGRFGQKVQMVSLVETPMRNETDTATRGLQQFAVQISLEN